MEVEADRCQKEGEDGQTKLVTIQGAKPKGLKRYGYYGC
jgi:hypothetical protein